MKKHWRLLAGAGAIGVCVGLYLLNPEEHALIPKCPMRVMTGFNCPGCGFQRAAHAALHGRFVEAVNYNLFLVLALPYLASLVVSDLLLHGEAQRRWQRVTHAPWLIYTYVGLSLVWWLVRNWLGV